MRIGQHLSGKTLRSLDSPEDGPFRSAGHQAFVVYLLHGVDDRNPWYHCTSARMQRLDHPGEQGSRSQATRGVVHQDESGFFSDRGQPLQHRLGSFCAAGDDDDPIDFIAQKQRLRFREVCRRSDQHYIVDVWAGKNLVQRMTKQGTIDQRDKSLRKVMSETAAGTGRHEDDSDVQEASTSSSMDSAFTSSVFSASASSETRI